MGSSCGCSGEGSVTDRKSHIQTQNSLEGRREQEAEVERFKLGIHLRHGSNQVQLAVKDDQIYHESINRGVSSIHHPNQDPDFIKVNTDKPRIETYGERSIHRVSLQIPSTNQGIKRCLYDRLGQEEGLKNFTDIMVQKIIGDNQLSVFFTGAQIEIYREKFKYYMEYILGQRKFWIGRSLKEVHQNLSITEDAYTCFVSHCEKALFELNLDRETVYETINKLSEIREDIITQQNRHTTLIDHLGGFQNLQLIAQLTMDKVINCPIIGQYFMTHDLGLHEKRITYYLFYVAGGSQEWIGRTLLQAHKGKGIQQYHFDKMVNYIYESMLETKVQEQFAMKLVELLIDIKHDIIEDSQQLTLYEKLDNNNKFSLVMTSFINKMERDTVLGQYFSNNQKMKHHIPNKILMFFAYTQGTMNADDMKNLRDIHKCLSISIFDFERSIRFFTEALYEHQIDHITVREAVLFYKRMKKLLVYDEQEEQINALQEQIHSMSPQPVHNNTSQLQQDSFFKSSLQQQLPPSCPFHNLIQSQKVDGVIQIPQNDQGIRTNYHNDIQKHQAYQEIQEEDIANIDKMKIEEIQVQEEQKVEATMIQLIKQGNNNNGMMAQQQIPKKDQSAELQPNVYQDILNQNDQVNHQIENLLHLNGTQKEQQPNQRERSNDRLWDEPVIYQGELSKFTDKNKAQIPRWLVLKSKCLIIYKDKISMLSYINKPLYIIRLQDIHQVKENQKTIKKNQQIFELDIEIKDNVSFNSSMISGFMADQAIRDAQGRSHVYPEKQIIMTSTIKKEISQWVNKLNAQLNAIKEQNKDINHLI